MLPTLRALLFTFAPIFCIGMPTHEIRPQDNKKQDQKTDLMQQAERLYFQKRYRSARKILQTLIQLDALNARAHLYLGDIHLKLADYNQAEETFRMALELTDETAPIHYRLGQTLYLKKDANGAIAAFEQALKKDKTLVASHFQIGLVHLMLQRDRGKTIEHWKKFRELAPDDPQGPEIDLAIRLLERTNLETCETTKQQALCDGTIKDENGKTIDLLSRDDL